MHSFSIYVFKNYPFAFCRKIQGQHEQLDKEYRIHAAGILLCNSRGSGKVSTAETLLLFLFLFMILGRQMISSIIVRRMIVFHETRTLSLTFDARVCSLNLVDRFFEITMSTNRHSHQSTFINVLRPIFADRLTQDISD